MTHEEYWDYYADMTLEIEIRFPSKQGWSDEHRLQIAEKTISPYHYWLENKALTTSPPDGKESSVRNETTRNGQRPQEAVPDGTKSSLNTEDSPNLSAKATEIREKLKAGIGEHKGQYTEFMSQKAYYALGDLIKDWAEGCRSWWLGIENNIPDSELVEWNQKHEVFE
jgi:hypothetical protein